MTVYVLVRDDQSEHGFVDASIVGLFRSHDEATAVLKSSMAEAREQGLRVCGDPGTEPEWDVSWNMSHIPSGNCLSLCPVLFFLSEPARSPARGRTGRDRGCSMRCETVMVNAPVPALLRQQVDRWAQTWLTAKFSRLLELRARDPGPFNYPIEVFAEWRGKAFYLNVRYRARSRKVEDDFVVRHTRMTLTGFGRFDLAYFRHTDKWFTVYRGLTAADCFREIEENEIFWPTT